MKISKITKIIKDHNNREMLFHGSISFPIALYYDDIKKYDLEMIDYHWHNELEIVVMVEGEAEITVGSNSIILKVGEALLINSKVLHSMKSYNNTNAVFYTIVFHTDLLGGRDSAVFIKYLEPFINNKSLKSLPFDSKQDTQLFNFINQILHGFANSNELTITKLMFCLWECIYFKYNETHMIKNNEESKLDKRMKLLLNYVHENYPNKFSLEDLAKGAYMSVSECCKLFNSYIAMTPYQYLTYYRLNKAAEYLKSNNYSIGEITSLVGFSSNSYFSKKFKVQFGYTPMEVKKMKS